MTTEEKEQYRFFLRDYVETITEPSPRAGNNKYNCPLCGSGTGPGGTGAFSIDRDEIHWKCFSCGAGGDIYDLAAAVQHIDKKNGLTPKEAFSYIKTLCSMENWQQARNASLPQDRRTNNRPPSKESPSAIEVLRYIDACAARVQETDYWKRRGISPETVKHFQLGYDPSCYSFGNQPAVVIPNQFYINYTARRVKDPADGGPRYHLPYGYPKRLYNRNALLTDDDMPIFVVEGEIDALSIEQTGHHAVAIGGTAGVHLLLEEKALLGKKLIISLDDDEPGRKAAEELKSKLDLLEVTYLEHNISGTYKDANAALVAEGEEFLSKGCDAAVAALLDTSQQGSVYSHYDNLLACIERGQETKAIRTGFPLLDQHLGGGMNPELYALGAMAGLGKTAFMMQIADSIAEQGTDVLVFALEMSEEQLFVRSISRTIFKKFKEKADYRTIMKGQYSKHPHFLEALENYKETAKHLYIFESHNGTTIADIRSTVDAFIGSGVSKPVVFVDYLQLLRPAKGTAMDKKMIVDEAVGELERMSREYHIPVMFISSFNRTSYASVGGYSSFKESGAIEYGAATILTLDYMETVNKAKKGASFTDIDRMKEQQKEKRKITLQILKNRFGPTGGMIAYEFDGACSLFKEIQDRANDTYGSVSR